MNVLPNLDNYRELPGFRVTKAEVKRHGDSVALQRIGACSASLREQIDEGGSIFDGEHLLDLCKALAQLIDGDRPLDEHIANLEHDARAWPSPQDARDHFADLDAKEDRL